MPPSSPLLAATLALAMSSPAGAAPDPLAGHAWTRRVLLAAAPSGHDPGLLVQRKLFAAMRAGAAERDLVLVEAVGDGRDARALRARFAIEPNAFRAVLVGKDGGRKLSSDAPLGPDRLFPVIDAMPMRRRETGGTP